MKKSHEMAQKTSMKSHRKSSILCLIYPFFTEADDALSLSTLRGGADALPADTSPAGAPFAVGGQLGKSSTRSAWGRNVDWCELMWMTSLWHRCLVYDKKPWVLIPKGLAVWQKLFSDDWISYNSARLIWWFNHQVDGDIYFAKSWD